jgi:hemolysin D
VRDGQAVKAGEVLIELDPTIVQAEIRHLQNDFLNAELQVARLSAALSESPDHMASFLPPTDANPEMVATQRRYLTDQVMEHRAKLAALDFQRAQKEAERNTITATIQKYETLIPVAQERVDIRRKVFEREYASKFTYLETLQSLVEMQKDLDVQKSRLNEADAAVSSIGKTRDQTEAEYRRTLYSDLVEAKQKADGLSNDLAKAEQRAKLLKLTAPIDGTVQQLAIHTSGGVVTPAQNLLVVVPGDANLEIEAMVSNRDIGFIHPGQDAEIKVETFNFTRYGLVHGKVLTVSKDAVVRDKSSNSGNERTSNSDSESSAPSDQQSPYSARISLGQTMMDVDGNTVPLLPGMAVTADIKTGERTIISYLLSPLLRYSQSSLRER